MLTENAYKPSVWLCWFEGQGETEADGEEDERCNCGYCYPSEVACAVEVAEDTTRLKLSKIDTCTGVVRATVRSHTGRLYKVDVDVSTEVVHRYVGTLASEDT